VKEICELSVEAMAVDVKVELIQALISIGLWHVKELLEQEVRQLAGGRYKRGGLAGYDRWGEQGGSEYLLDHKVPIMVPRVRDQGEGKEVRLRSYEQLQSPRDRDEGVLRRILRGLSCRSYEECAADVPEAFSSFFCYVVSLYDSFHRYLPRPSEAVKSISSRRVFEVPETACLVVNS